MFSSVDWDPQSTIVENPNPMPRKIKPKNFPPDLFSELDPPSPPIDSLQTTATVHAPPSPIQPAMCHHLAEIAVVGPVRGTFTYIADAVWDQLSNGSRVLVPFGGRTLPGYFIGERKMDDLLRAGVDSSKLKSIITVLKDAEWDTLLTPSLLELARWISRHYACPLGSTLSAMLPGSIKKGSAFKKVLHSSDERSLEQDSDLALTAKQQCAFNTIETSFNQGAHAAFLLQGVTGSGKTEVYLRVLKAALANNKQGIVLVPEIALTPQTAERFQRRLGQERVAILHSHVTEGERARAWRAIRAGKIDVVVGARSALFAPLPRLGLIVIDEEHESAFKQESTPRYHARDVAMELARLSNAILILGSATPSFETFHAARTGRIKHLFLTERVAGRPMPPVEIVDLTQENRETERYTYLSRRLISALRESLSRKEQAILFMNRRGFATVITCLRCGHTEKCHQCDIALTSHRQRAPDKSPTIEPHLDNAAGGVPAVRGCLRNAQQPQPPSKEVEHGALNCHYCGMSKPIPDVCNGCGAPGLKHWGLGTERIENEVKKLFPDARVARMDSDTMTRRTAYSDTLDGFRSGKIDILVGTQMIAKGLDFPNVTLVGVVLADTALHMPDFRSRERTFQLLAQVAGRAGRSEKGGKVIVQTHLPQDPAIRAAAHHDFESFSLNELQERRAYHYPPFARLARILIRGKDLKTTRMAAETLAAALRTHCAQQALPNATHAALVVMGPSEAPIARLKGYFRQHILLKANDSKTLSEILSGPIGDTMLKLKGVDAIVDVDPVGMM